MSDIPTTQTLCVHHEWGALKEVLIGAANLRIPSTIPEASKKYLPAAALEFMTKNAGKRLQEADPKLQERYEHQINTIIKILQERGIIVHQIEKHTPSEESYLSDLSNTVLQTFARDITVVIGNQAIEMAMYEPYRRKERFAIRRTLAQRFKNLCPPLIAMPEPFPNPANQSGKYGPDAYLEGGDILLVGQDIFVGNTGNASSSAGIQWLQGYLGDEYRVHEITLSDRFLHLDCVLSLPRPGLAIICKEGFIHGIPEFLKDWKLIEVSAEDVEQKMGCNVMIIDMNTIMIGDDMPQLANQLIAEGIEVITTPIDAFTWQGGGLRCLHHPLIRESVL